MFTGSFLYTLDSKNRLSIPAKLRKNLTPESNESFKIRKGFDNCLELFPMDEWLKMAERMMRLNEFDNNDRSFLRRYNESALDVEMDNQSRIIIPQSLLEFAKIEKEVFILGVLNKIELWNPKTYEDYVANAPDNFEQLAAKVMKYK